ncbi:MAG TPA: hypothetical protein VMZ11_04325 [Mycobacteriales bacterium]|nr:hypothetical protein [Mycobacteriales bacterium]
MTVDPSEATPDELRRVLKEAERTRSAPTHRGHLVREEFARVSFNLWPSLIPRESVDPAVLTRLVAQEFGSVLDRAALFRGVPADVRGNITLEAALAHALSSDDDNVFFQGGYLATPDSNRVTPVVQLGFGEQNLVATVAGRSDEAEYVCKRLAILISQSANVKRVWSDFENHVELIGYTTSSVVDLGFSMRKMLSEGLRQFIADTLEGGLGQRMGGWSKDDVAEQDKRHVVAGVRNLEFTVSVTDPVSGQNRTCMFELLSHTKSDLNRSRVKVLSELRSSDHEALVDFLISSVDS